MCVLLSAVMQKQAVRHSSSRWEK